MEIGEKSLGVYFGDVLKRGIDSRTISYRIFHVYVCTRIIVGYGASLMTLPLRMYKSTCGYFGSWIQLRYDIYIYMFVVIYINKGE